MKLHLTHRAIGAVLPTVAVLTLLSGCGNQAEEPAPISSKVPVATSAAKPSTSPASGAAKTPTATKSGDPAKLAKSCTGATPVKGNMGKEKVYHLPTSKGYDAVKAEECFKDAASAEKAGYRAPK
jgi:hypothetical protein